MPFTSVTDKEREWSGSGLTLRGAGRCRQRALAIEHLA